MTPRRDRWHVLGAAAVLSPSEAVEALGGRAATAREWLQARGLIRDIPGLGRRVVWGDVLDEIRLDAARDPEAQPVRGRLPRAVLRPRR